MNNSQRITELYKDKHPGIGSYLECVTRAYAYGLAGFTLGNKNIHFKIKFESLFYFIGFSSIYFTQKLIQQRFPYKLKTIILISTLVGCTCSYKITSDRTKICQAAWLASEDKHTALSDENPDQI